MFPKGFSEEPPETHHTRFKNDFWQSLQTLQYHKRSTDSQLKKYRAHLSKWRIFRTAITETASRIGINSNVEKQIWNWIELLQKFIAVESLLSFALSTLRNLRINREKRESPTSNCGKRVLLQEFQGKTEPSS